MENILPILVADDPKALTELCGVNLLERLLRILQRLGFREAIVFSTTPEIGAELARRSWPRNQITANLVSSATKPLTAQWLLEQSPADCFLIIPANIYCDARLLAALCAKDSSVAARPRRSWLAASGSEFSLLSYLASSMDWMESSHVSKSKRLSVGNGNIISII